MTRLQRALIFAFALIPSLLLVGERAWAGEYRIAVLAYRGKAEALRQWRGHADYLNARLAPDRFEVVPLGYDQIDKAVAQGSVSFVITNSGHYTELELRGAVAALATRLLAGQGEALDRFGGVLITRPERTDINGYADLAGSSVLYPDRSSLGGWQVHLREAIEAGVDAQDFEGIETGDHEAVVRGVLAGQADAGFVRSDLLESMAAAGKLSLSAVRVVAPRGTPGYPYLHSTRLYPEWPFASVAGVPDALARRVAVALLSMPAGEPAAQSAGLLSWTSPRNYQSIHELFRTAYLGPYSRERIGWRQVVTQYDLQISIFIAAVIAMLAAALLLIRRSNRALRTERDRHRDTAEQLSEREARFRSLFEENVLGIIYQEPNGRIVAANRAAERILGIPAPALQGLDAFYPEWHAVHPDGRPMAPEEHPSMRALAERRVLCGKRMGIHTPSQNSTHWLNVSAVPQFRPGETAPFQIFVVFEDITEQVNIETRLRLLATVFADTHEGILIVDGKRRIIEVNNAATTITGFSREELVGQPANLTHAPGQPASLYREIRESLLSTGHWRGEMQGQRRDGSTYPVQVSTSVVHDNSGQITHTVGVFSDITALHESRARLEHQAYFDALTGLPNRVLLLDRMQHAIAAADRNGDMLAVCYLDLDGFKPVNDTWGHAMGDSLLGLVATRLQKLVRASDTVSRLGGDEFVIIFGSLADPHEATAMLKRLCGLLAEPYQLGEQQVTVSASVGVTLYPDDEGEPGILIRHADHAMYEAKKAGRNRFHVYDPEHEKVDESRSESRRIIEDAIAGNEFRLFYQPKVDMRAGKVIGAEALIRWQHPERGLLNPDEFLPVVEYVGLNVELGRWVLDTAFAQAQAWQDAGLALSININIAVDQLQHPDLVKDLAALIERYPRVAPSSIELEIVETAALRNLGEIAARLKECQALGFRFAVDDFGTGYSSLSYLKSLPVDTLKIDQVFVRDMLDDPEDLAIVEGVIAMAGAFRRSVIAEGMETAAHGRMLLSLGCELAQGYGIARPMPAEALPDWIAAWRSPEEWHAPNIVRWNREDLPLLTIEVTHKHWLRDLEHFLSSPQPRALPKAEGRLRCDLDHWLKGEGLRRYGHNASFHALAETHNTVHQIAAELIACKLEGRKIDQALLDTLDTASTHLALGVQLLRAEIELMNNAPGRRIRNAAA